MADQSMETREPIICIPNDDIREYINYTVFIYYATYTITLIHIIMKILYHLYTTAHSL